jgi:hypothetical protein
MLVGMESTEVEVDTLHSVAMIHAGLQTHFHYSILFRNSVMMMDLTECKQLLQCCLTYKEIKKNNTFATEHKSSTPPLCRILN